ncbi:hypothetical protein [Mycobacterium bohemicum]|uniref:hypothetical protein n=1 Tax=Mycobacterium bohemicum TaxID=56425 RepID=UPI0014787C7B|nr:hypothetical protein [Mycobacterium bohemicum]
MSGADDEDLEALRPPSGPSGIDLVRRTLEEARAAARAQGWRRSANAPACTSGPPVSVVCTT